MSVKFLWEEVEARDMIAMRYNRPCMSVVAVVIVAIGLIETVRRCLPKHNTEWQPQVGVMAVVCGRAGPRRDSYVSQI